MGVAESANLLKHVSVFADKVTKKQALAAAHMACPMEFN